MVVIKIRKCPWKVSSLYQFQFFNCPECDFKSMSKQIFVDHACQNHPESQSDLQNISDESVKGLTLPWRIIPEIKQENEAEELIDENLDHGIELADQLEDQHKSSDDEYVPDVEDYDDLHETIESHEIKDIIVDGLKDDVLLSFDLARFRCKWCEKSDQLQTMTEYNQHLKTVHFHDLNLPCGECKEEFCSSETLDLHYKICHKIQTFSCGLCLMNLARESSLMRHIGSRHSKQCYRCEKRFEDSTKVEKHIIEVHGKKQRWQRNDPKKSLDSLLESQNDVSNNKKDTSKDLEMKTMIEVQNESKPVEQTPKTTNDNLRFRCKWCERSEYYQSIAELDRHLNRVHNHYLPLKCDKCKERFYSSDTLDLHNESVHDTKTFTCGLCSDLLAQKFTLNRHISKKHRTQCYRCSDEFKNSKDLENHINEQHGKKTFSQCIELLEDTYKNFHGKAEMSLSKSTLIHVQCKWCKNSDHFKSIVDLDMHLKNNHSHNLIIFCSECGEKFFSSETLDIHHKVCHQSEKTTCGLCLMNFSERSSFLRHLARKHPSQCDRCASVFEKAEKLTAHKKLKHEVISQENQDIDPLQDIASTNDIETNSDYHEENESSYDQIEEPIVKVEERDEIIELIGNDSDTFDDFNDETKEEISNDDPKINKTKPSRKRKRPSYLEDDEDWKENESIKCTECEEIFESMSRMRCHRTRKHRIKPEPRRISPLKALDFRNCKDCNIESFESPDNMELHFLHAHDKSKSVHCNLCSSSFCLPNILDWHCQVYHDLEQYTCPQCFLALESLTGRTLHMIHSHGYVNENKREGRVYKCLNCDWTGLKMIEHWSNDHKGEPLPVSCSKCDFKTYTQGHLEKHIKNNHSGNFKCDECTFTCGNKVTFAFHVKSKHKEANIKRPKRDRRKKRIHAGFQCSNCDWKGHKIKEHWEENHSDCTLPYLCHICNFRTFCQNYLNRHIAAIHEHNELTCEYCDFKSMDAKVMTAHKRTHLDIKKFTCDVCARGLKDARTLRVHQYRMHGIKCDKKYMETILKNIEKGPKIVEVLMECLNCHHKDFTSVKDFNLHVSKCYGSALKKDIEFICNKKNCEESFSAAEVLHYHLFSAHNVSDRVCDICGAIIKCMWGTKVNLDKHKDHVHYNIQKYQCEICSQFFKTNAHKNIHMNVQHRGIKRFKCDMCDYKVDVKSTLTYHVKSVHTKEPFYCNYCDFTCTSRKTHQMHVTKVHAPYKNRKILVTKE